MPRSDMKAEFRALRETAIDQGWRVDMTAGSHWRFKPPVGEIIVTSGSPSDPRAFLNIKSRLRRGGLK